jgi:hypothetical protein
MQRMASLFGLTAILLLGIVGAASAGVVVKTPEPASMTLLAVGTGVVALIKFRKRK